MKERMLEYIDKVFIYSNGGDSVMVGTLLIAISVMLFIVCVRILKPRLGLWLGVSISGVVGVLLGFFVIIGGMSYYEGYIENEYKDQVLEIEEMQIDFVSEAIEHRVAERSLPPIGVLETDLGITKDDVGSVVVKTFDFDLDLLEEVKLYVVSSDLYEANELMLLDMNILKRHMEKALKGVTITSNASHTGMLEVDNFKVDTSGTVVSDISFVINIK